MLIVAFTTWLDGASVGVGVGGFVGAGEATWPAVQALHVLAQSALTCGVVAHDAINELQ